MSDTTLRRMRKDLGIVLRNDDPVKLARQRDRMRRRRQLEIALDGQLPTRYSIAATMPTPPPALSWPWSLHLWFILKSTQPIDT